MEAVEFVLLSIAERRENVALAFRYRDDELARWQSLVLAGQTLAQYLTRHTGPVGTR